VRLVTLTGPGEAGKIRLTLAVGQHLPGNHLNRHFRASQRHHRALAAGELPQLPGGPKSSTSSSPSQRGFAPADDNLVDRGQARWDNHREQVEQAARQAAQMPRRVETPWPVQIIQSGAPSTGPPPRRSPGLQPYPGRVCGCQSHAERRDGARALRFCFITQRVRRR